MSNQSNIICPDCAETIEHIPAIKNQVTRISRREFLTKTGKTSVALAATPLITAFRPGTNLVSKERTEDFVRALHTSLSESQRRAVLLPWDDPRRLRVENNWRVVPERIGRFFNSEQQELVREILKNTLSEQGFEKVMRAMKDDAGSLDRYSACLFSNGNENLAFMLTGRHQTIRAVAGESESALLSGPMFYGHAVTFNERPDHPGNVWWHQARLASKVYHALDGKQQEQALVLHGSPADRASSIELQGGSSAFKGMPVSELSPDQKELVEEVMRSLLEPYSQTEVDAVMASIKSNSGLDKLHLTFYKDGDLPDKDGIWDRWKLEGPALVWYFRGSPHVHTWINIGQNV